MTGSAPHVRLQWRSARANNTSWPTNCSFRPCSMIRSRGWWASELRRYPVVLSTGSYGHSAPQFPYLCRRDHASVAPRWWRGETQFTFCPAACPGPSSWAASLPPTAWNSGPRGLPRLGAHPLELRGDIGARPIHASV